jgi:3-carboxy-cis,cis-muconate cycloisomerase
LIVLTETHSETLLAGRTWLQQGPPILFGLKTAGWLFAILRHRERLAAVTKRALCVQFGGAVGTLASLGDRGGVVGEALANALHLPLPEIPWHSERDSIAEMATTLGLLTGTLGKIARDISLMMQSEIAEVQEPQVVGKGGSSTMPHKRNPVGSAVVLSASIRVPGLVATMLSAMVQEHERGVGGWHAEWETLPEICKLASGALKHTIAIVSGLEVDAARMRANLDALHGLALAESISILLSQHVGRPVAHHILEEASRIPAHYNPSFRRGDSPGAIAGSLPWPGESVHRQSACEGYSYSGDYGCPLLIWME